MPSCAFKECKNHSSTSNKSHNITFHSSGLLTLQKCVHGHTTRLASNQSLLSSVKRCRVTSSLNSPSFGTNMPSCAVKECTNHSRKDNKSQNITFHSFPRDEIWKHKWLVVLRRQRKEPYWMATHNSRICSQHFDAQDIYTTPKGLMRITKGAVPIFEEDIMPQRAGSPNSLSNVDISDCESIFDTPMKQFLKRRVRELTERKRKLTTENKNIRRKNARLMLRNEAYKQAIVKLKKRVNVLRTIIHDHCNIRRYSLYKNNPAVPKSKCETAET